MNAATQSRRPLFSHARTWGLAALAVALHSGCGREFFREWANQDVSEAVFEKSRDPRWRIDLFSVDPPSSVAVRRPLRPRRPPRPPRRLRDAGTVTGAPVARQPPAGAGRGDRLPRHARRLAAPIARGCRHGRRRAAPPGPAGATPPDTRAPAMPAPPVPPPDAASPFGREGNSGTDRGGISPRRVPGPLPTNPNPPESSPSQTSQGKRDLGVRRAAFQETGLPRPVPTPLPAPSSAPRGPSRELPTPPIGMDPNPTEPDLSAPISPRPDLSPEQYRTSEAMGAEMAGILVPGRSNSTRPRRPASPEPADLTC